MAGWQEELAMLLRELGVTQEESTTHLQSTRNCEASLHHDHLRRHQAKPHRDDATWREQTADAVSWDDMSLPDADGDGLEDNEVWLTDLRLMRRQVESIVTQVIRLAQRGDLDESSKEDVMVVLHALCRRATVTQQAAASDTAYLEFAAAMLHFCRLVLRLSESAIEDL